MVERRAKRTGGGGREAYYQKLLREQERSGRSLRAFARERGLSAWTLYGWRRKLEGSRRRAEDGGGLVAVDLRDGAERKTVSRRGFEVVLADGCRVLVGADFAAERLAELLAVLRSC